MLPHECSINTATLGHKEPLKIVIDRVARHGFGGIAPWRRDLDGCDLSVVAKQIKDSGLEVSGLCRSEYIPSISEEHAKRAFEQNIRAIDQACVLGSACYILVVGGLPTGSKDLFAARSAVIDGIERLLEYSKSVGMPLAIEPLHPMYAADRSCVTTVGEALDICAILDPDGKKETLGVALDVYHIWWDWQLHANIEKAGKEDRILAFHICDWRVPTRDFLTDRGMMGEGVIDLETIRREIKKAGYLGLAEIEIFSEELWKEDPEVILQKCANQIKIAF